MENCAPGTGEGKYGQESLTRKVTFKQRLEGSERVSLENVGVISIPEKKGAIRTKPWSWAHEWPVEEL